MIAGLWGALAGCTPDATESHERTTTVLVPDGSSPPTPPPPAPGVEPEAAEILGSVPVFGGTLESVPDLGTFVAADPANDRLIVRVSDDTFSGFELLDLGANSRPFRLLVEGTRVWVTLRGTGELVEVDLTSPASVVWRRRVCTEPRGVARSPFGTLVVACAEGLLVEVGTDGSVLRSTFVMEDLRDIVPVGDTLYVSRFTSAEVLGVDPATFAVTFRVQLDPDASTAWRMRPDQELGGVWVLHQFVTARAVRLDREGSVENSHAYDLYFGYGLPCGGLANRRLTRLPPPPSPAEPELAPVPEPGAAIGVSDLVADFAIGADGTVVLAKAGAVSSGDIVWFDHPHALLDPDRCATGQVAFLHGEGITSAVGFDGAGSMIRMTTAPTEIIDVALDATLLPGEPGEDDDLVVLFHRPEDLMSCATCHPEGLDDGHVWTFGTSPDGAYLTEIRRTMSLAGVLDRAPYQWSANLADPDAFMAHTYTGRMDGGVLDADTTTRLFAWLDGLRRVRSTDVDPPSIVDQGGVAFVDAGCDTCHSGPAFTNGTIEEVRAGVEAVKTPSLLGVGVHHPLMHDGCADTLGDVFVAPCDDGTDAHGALSLLDDAGRAALIAYLRTL